MIRLCLDPSCPNPATYRGRCQRHARAQDRNINRAGYRIYRTKRWRITRQRQLANHPLCECGQIATDVHHIIDLKDGGNPWNPANLQSLCHSCHAQISRRSQRTAPTAMASSTTTHR